MQSLTKSLFSSIIPQNKSRHFLLLLVMGAIMLYLRIAPNYVKIFTDWPGDYGNFVNFSADDAVYHMRFVHNTLWHFPLRVFFDPFTHFPYGSYIAFGPLYTLIIAGVALIAGFGHPSPELVNHVAAYTPPVMGALCLIPVYFIARQLFGKSTAILAALVLTFLPGEFLSRSALGFADHHVAETLFTTIMCAFLIYALKATTRLKFITYGLLTGITFGLFILVWQGALLFGGIFLIFFITQLLITRRNKDTKYLLSLASLIYITPIIVILPYTFTLPLTQYPGNNIVILITSLAIFSICYLLHIICQYNKLTNKLYPLILAGTAVFVAFILITCFSQIYALMQHGFNLLFRPTPGMLTVSEVHPAILDHHGKFTIALFWKNLFWTIPLGIIGLSNLIADIYHKQSPAQVFLLIWTLVIISATCAQIRFNYYLAINAALLAGYGIYFLLSLIDYFKPQKKFYLKLQKISFFTLFFVLVILIIDPMIMLLMDRKIPSGIQITREWYDSLMWLKKHTPDPQGKTKHKNFSYIDGYYPVPKNLNARYNYPKSAYGIMSWWDTGHQITYIAERIPNANPFQLGIIENQGKAGAALFFTSTNEKKAVANLDTVGARYVIISSDTLTFFNSIGVWCNDTQNWEQDKTTTIKLPKKTINLQTRIDSPKFKRSIINRLFYNDANGTQHFRLIYESAGDYRVKAKQITVTNEKARSNSKEWLFKNYPQALATTKKINKVIINNDHNIFTYNARPPVKGIKIFEKVKGAIINGKAPKNIADNTPVKLTLKLTTKYGRIFTYQQTTKIKHGKYKFIVPYPTTKMHGKDYSYDTKPIGSYVIQINNQVIKVAVPEDAVMLGKNIEAKN